MNNPFLKAPKPVDPQRAEQDAQPASRKINLKTLLWSVVVIFLLPVPGIISTVLVVIAPYVKTRGREEKLLYFARIINMTFTIFGIFVNLLGILRLFV